MTASQSLAAKLDADAFGPVFVWPQHDATLARVWAEPGAAHHLEALIDDASAPAAIYAAALQRRSSGSANGWGLLWINDDLGTFGGRFLILGRAAIPALRALLTDATVIDWYAGSETATVGNGARYRIEDVAAYYLARIIGYPLAFHAEVAARDAAIAGLVSAVDSE
jgi:hypothetical protein